MAVYLLHFDAQLGPPGSTHGRAQHYLGFTPDHNLENRLDEHAHGGGAKITAAFAQHAIPFRLARLWPNGDPKLEKHLKHYKNAPARLCPICKANRTPRS